uniref:Uncharacterized protein n=1 Tax=Steinernema glaseri TaxID=37863 RepID=A0A1I7YZQ4_9BILA
MADERRCYVVGDERGGEGRSVSSTEQAHRLVYGLKKLSKPPWPCGLKEKASVSGAEDCGFESRQGPIFFWCTSRHC